MDHAILWGAPWDTRGRGLPPPTNAGSFGGKAISAMSVYSSRHVPSVDSMSGLAPSG